MDGVTDSMNWIPLKERTVPQILDRMVRLRPARAWLVILILTVPVALVDLVTGPDIWFGPVYLLVMCVVAWMRGWKAGQAFGIACMALTFSINGSSLYPYGDTDILWNLGMRFCALSIVIAAISGMRGAYIREWWLARTDTLTKALNRQAFFELAPRAIEATRWRLMVYADLDGLKKINDKEGHAAGDACLQAFGSAVSKMIRQNDIFARVGGDEFIIFMSVTDDAAARAVATRLHKTINNIETEWGKVTCSVGGLVVSPGSQSLDDLVRSADHLMYQAKLRGAGLQMGNAGDGSASEVDRARTGSARLRIAALARSRSTVDRRARSESTLVETAPR